MINEHNAELEKIFKVKKYDHKKVRTLISLSMSPLDQRLVFYEQYYNTDLEPDDIQRLKVCIEVNLEHPKRYIPFTQSDLCTKICNYNLCLSPLRECIRQVLVNPYGFSNLVYLHLSDTDDPYSFYSLEKIDSDGKRCWKMECRLDEISRFIREHLQTFCINMFRKIYRDIFSDNLYRKDYMNKAVICSQDCEQLLMNISILGRQKKFCNMMRDLLSEQSVIQPTKLDKFNFKRDDPLVKKYFHAQNEDDEGLTNCVERLFDQIKEDDRYDIVSRLD